VFAHVAPPLYWRLLDILKRYRFVLRTVGVLISKPPTLPGRLFVVAEHGQARAPLKAWETIHVAEASTIGIGELLRERYTHDAPRELRLRPSV
jgi:hypothetical protein